MDELDELCIIVDNGLTIKQAAEFAIKDINEKQEEKGVLIFNDIVINVWKDSNPYDIAQKYFLKIDLANLRKELKNKS